MANNALALRMKYRKFTAEQLNEIIENENSSELEVKVAQEFLDKLGGEAEEQPAKAAPAKKSAPKKEDKKVPAKKAAPKKEETADDDPDPEDGSPKAAMKRQNKRNSTYQSEEQLTPEEEERLAKAEAEYEERQKNRKTPSKSDKSMKEKMTPHETKRQNLEESEEIPGLKVGSKVILKGEDAVGEITRLYKSGDGKEKCMVKFGDDKPIKKRVTALELAEDAKPAPAKKTPKK